MTISERTLTGPRLGLPHGGQLVDRRLGVGEAEALAASRLPSLALTAAEAADLRALASGAYSPLTGFLGAKEHESVSESMRPEAMSSSIRLDLPRIRRTNARLLPSGDGVGRTAPPGPLTKVSMSSVSRSRRWIT